MSEDNSNAEILPLTSLRFVAALFVYLFHIQLSWPIAEAGTLAGNLLGRGAVGMSIFFVLSGFVLAVRFRDGVPHFARYAYSRFTRIYPVYALAAIATLPLLLSTIDAQQDDTTGARRVLQYIFVVGADTFLLQAWIPELFKFWNNGASWSISVETFFYALFPVILFLLRDRAFALIAAVGLIAVVFSGFVGLSTILFAPENSVTVFYATPIYRVAEFICGVACGVLFTNGVRIRNASIVFVLSALGLATFLALGPPQIATYVANNFAAVPLVALTIWAAASMNGGPISAVMSWPPLVYLGKISYSFYSFQIVALFWMSSHYDAITAVLGASTWSILAATFVPLVVISATS